MPSKKQDQTPVKVIAASKPPDDKKTTLGLIVASLLFLIVLAAIGYLYSNLKTLKNENMLKTPNFQKAEPAPQNQEIPTLSTEEIEIIKQMETHSIILINNSVTPETVTIKVHDQVQWENQDTEKNYQITGNDWGGVPIGPGERFTQTFSETGRFSYYDDLNPEINGVIIVK